METKNAKTAPTVSPVTNPTAPTVSTAERKAFARAEYLRAVEAEKAERLALRAVGTVGFYGRVPSVIDALRAVAVETPSASFTVEAVALRAEKFFRSANPDRKVSANSSRLYTGEIAEALRLLALLALDPTAKSETYRFASPLLALLAPKK